MKANYIKCDRCGKFEEARKIFDGHLTIRRFEKRYEDSNTGDLTQDLRGITLDLCEACEDQLRDFLKGKEKRK